MAEDPVAEIARTAAKQLAPELGVWVETEVEAALCARDGGERHEYDAVAIGALIVSIAQLAWTIYSDHRNKAPDAPQEVAERVLRTEIRREVEVAAASLKITDVVVQEVIARNHRP
ncbi:MAG TPA: hypothetical protein VGG75_26045 [Trebonia sp.]|jgi:hypothetical protein